MNEKDRLQTERCNQLRNFLQSIAIQAVEAQDYIGTDKCDDLLYDIEKDVDIAMELSNKLNTEW